MSFSAGVYTLPGAALNTGDTVSATENNTLRNDMASSFNLTWLRNGTAAATANIPMGGFELTNAAAIGSNSSLLLKSNNGTTAVTIDTAQNVGVGVTPSAWNSIFKSLDVGATASFVGSSGGANVFNNAYYNGTDYIYKTTAAATRYLQSSGAHNWFNAPSGTAGNAISFTQAMTLDASGRLGIGITSPGSGQGMVQVAGAGQSWFKFYDSSAGWNFGTFYKANGTTALAYIGGGGGSAIAGGTVDDFVVRAEGNLLLAIGSTERARIDSSGNLLVGTTSNIVNGNARVQVVGTAGIRAQSTTSGETSVGAFATSTGATYYYIGYDMTAGAIKYQVLFNGNVQNTNNSYGAISDVKLKENIVDASPKLANLMQVKVRNYNLIGDTTKQIGVVAQELETVFPSMIEETADYEDVPTTDANGNETTERVATGTKTKAVKYSVFVPMLIKAIQEQQSLIQSLTDRLTALEGAAK